MIDISKFDRFLEQLKGVERVIIQASDFPNHDALTSAFAFAYLLKKKGFKPFISYRGYINRLTLRNLIEWLKIPTISPDRLKLTPNDKIIVVGGCIGGRNVTDLPGIEVAVIDHHNAIVPSFVWYSDIRPEYGTTASMIVDYFKHCRIEMSSRVATALLVALQLDTDNFSQPKCIADSEALKQLQQHADIPLVNRICRNKIEVKDLQYFDAMLATMNQDKNCAFAVLPETCSQQLLGMLGDFLLSVDGIDIAVLSTRNNGKIYISLHSECINNDVNKIIVRVLNDSGIGFGGGLPSAAGGIIDGTYQYSQARGYVQSLISPHLLLS